MPKAKVNGININYKVEGQGEPLVMIMGLGGDRRGWFFHTRVFKKHYRVITFDSRGGGKTDKPSGPYTTKMMADDTIGLMDYLDIDSAHILGISMGGLIAQEVAINYPDRVKTLVLGCTNASSETIVHELTSIYPEIGKLLESVETSNRSKSKAVSIVPPLLFNNKKWLWKIFFLVLSWILLLLMPFFKGRTRGVMGQYKAGLAHDTLNRLSSIKAPTLVITGTADRAVPCSSSEAIANRIPNARLVKVENGSHAFFVEMRGRFNQEVLEFLGSS